MVWLKFLLSAVVIVVAGTRLTKFADELSEKLKLGKAWIGIILLGLVTSLPEAITSYVSIVTLDAPDLAIGNLVGSNVFNPMLIVVLDIVYRKGAIANRIEPNRSHNFSALFAVILSALVTADIYFRGIGQTSAMGGVSTGPLMAAALYLFGVKFLSSAEPKIFQGGEIDPRLSRYSLKAIWINIVVAAVFVIAAAIVLTHAADRIAEQTGLGETFVGSTMLALVTSLPEIVVSVSAFRLGAIDLGVGNIFGSNMFNMFIVSFCELFETNGAILALVSRDHAFTGLLGILLTGMALLTVHIRTKRSFLGLGWNSCLMVGLFLGGNYLLYTMSH